MNIPFLDLGAAYRELQSDIDAAVARSLASGWYIGGPEVEAFEHEFAAYTQAQHCIGVANGLDALHLALRAMDVGPGDEVIVPSNTYIATWLAVSQCGATPVPVEPDARTFNIDPALIEAAITPRTKVILPVHLYGQPADMDPILAIARKHGLRVLEDGAQAHGARYKGQRLLQRVALRVLHHIQMPYRRSPFGHMRQGQTTTSQALPVTLRHDTAASIPFIELRQLDAQDGSLQRVEPAVIALYFVHISHA